MSSNNKKRASKGKVSPPSRTNPLEFNRAEINEVDRLVAKVVKFEQQTTAKLASLWLDVGNKLADILARTCQTQESLGNALNPKRSQGWIAQKLAARKFALECGGHPRTDDERRELIDRANGHASRSGNTANPKTWNVLLKAYVVGLLSKHKPARSELRDELRSIAKTLRD